MQTITAIADEVLALRGLLEDVFAERRTAGVALCIDGSDRLELAAPCGCCARWLYEHAYERTPGMVRCALRPFDECEGFRSLLPDESTFVACDAHAAECRAILVETEREDLAELEFALTGVDPWWAWPVLSTHLASDTHTPGREALLAALRGWAEPPASSTTAVR